CLSRSTLFAPVVRLRDSSMTVDISIVLGNYPPFNCLHCGRLSEGAHNRIQGTASNHEPQFIKLRAHRSSSPSSPQTFWRNSRTSSSGWHKGISSTPIADSQPPRICYGHHQQQNRPLHYWDSALL